MFLGYPLAFWQLHLLVLCRVSSFLVTAPVFSSRSIPPLAKIGLATLVAILIAPQVRGYSGLETASWQIFVMRVIAEVLVGLALGWIASLTFNAIRVAGEMIDLQTGFSMAQLFDPQQGYQVSLLGQLMVVLGTLLYLAIGGHLVLLESLGASYNLIPPGGAGLAQADSAIVAKIFVGSFALGFRMAAPLLAVLAVTDIALSLVARTVPQLNVFILGFPLKAGVALVALELALPLLSVMMGQVFDQVQKDLSTIVRSLAP
ncbi:MAG: flagellar type III secretion system protein FliR [Clostridia bacterium]|nr:flagellar type III secretion system protein FliR [Clostridia bacterium]